MFTGLVQAIGEVWAADRRGDELRLRLQPRPAFPNVVIGESIAVNGACLSVEEANSSTITMYASGETLSRTSLGRITGGSRVNLERALAMGDRLGGHLVSGHVDCLARVEAVTPAGESRRYRFTFPAEHGRFVVPKGSVALDGISLTVNACGDDFLEVNIIPSTQAETTILDWRPGYEANMETDLIGKYVQRMLAPFLGQEAQPQEKSSITMEFLRQHGF